MTCSHFSCENVKLKNNSAWILIIFAKKSVKSIGSTEQRTVYTLYCTYTVQYVKFYLALLDVKEDIGHTGPVAAPRLQDQPEVVVAGGLTQLKLVLCYGGGVLRSGDHRRVVGHPLVMTSHLFIPHTHKQAKAVVVKQRRKYIFLYTYV